MSSGVTEFLSDLPILPNSRVTGCPSWVNPSASEPSTSSAGTYTPRPSLKA